MFKIHINMSYNIVLNIKLIPNALFIMSWVKCIKSVSQIVVLIFF